MLADSKAEVVLIHLNHTNPLLAVDSPERAEAVAAGFKVRSPCTYPNVSKTTLARMRTSSLVNLDSFSGRIPIKYRWDGVLDNLT